MLKKNWDFRKKYIITQKKTSNTYQSVLVSGKNKGCESMLISFLEGRNKNT